MKKKLSYKFIVKYQYYKIFGKKFNFKDPKTFSEKIQWIKINSNLEKVSNLIDKYKVINYIEVLNEC